MLRNFKRSLIALLGFSASVPAVPAARHEDRSVEARRDNYNYLCSSSYIGGLVSKVNQLTAVTYHLHSITTTIVDNYTAMANPGGPTFPAASGFGFCNMTMSMSHDNLNDTVSVLYPSLLTLPPYLH